MKTKRYLTLFIFLVASFAAADPITVVGLGKMSAPPPVTHHCF